MDGATVLFVTKTETDFGVATTLDGGNVAIVRLAIAQYEESHYIYLFACDAQWGVIGDLLYDSVGEAQQDAERYYKTSPLEWIEVRS